MAIAVHEVCYVRLGTGDLQRGANFLSDVLGLQRVPSGEGDALFRCDYHFYRVCLTDRSPDQEGVGIELLNEKGLEAAKNALQAAGFQAREATADECKRRFVKQAVIASDGSGNAIELVTRPAQSGRRYFPARDAGITGFLGVALRSIDIKRDVAFWTEVLDARISDRVGDVTYLQIDGRHHRIALYPASRNGVLEVSFDVESVDAVMQGNYFMRERQIKIVHGPGKETASGQEFVRFQDPDGHLFRYGHGMRDVDKAKSRPRQFSFQPDSLCAWGSECSDVPELRPSSAI